MLHHGRIRLVQIPVRQAEIAVAEAQMLESQGVIAEVEIRRLVLAGVEDLDAIVGEVALAEDRIEEVVGLVAPLQLVPSGQAADEEVVPLVKTVPEVGECDLDLALCHAMPS